MHRAITANTLFCGDNLPVLRENVLDESVDLVYLDPPFNAKGGYNALFRDESGKYSEAQIKAFEDTWHWSGVVEQTYDELRTAAPEILSGTMEALRGLVGTNQVMAYLVMMASRLVELHRVLKPTGSLYLHCDPTVSHYLKIILDAIFGPENFRNEIVWKRKAGRGETNGAGIRFGASQDILLFYARSKETPLNRQYRESHVQHLGSKFTHMDPDGRRYHLDSLASSSYRPNLVYEYKGYAPPSKGWAVSRERMAQMEAEGLLHFPVDKSKRIRRKRYLDKLEGETVDSLWDDIPPLNARAAERLGYPTQKPLALLERVIRASSNPGEVVLDPFCGCGTSIAAAQKLERRWIGIDITHLSIALMKYRLEKMFPGIEFEVVGEPTDIEAARRLAREDPYQFQWWALSLVCAKPGGRKAGGKTTKKSSKRGAEGVINFVDDDTLKPKRVLVHVRSGEVKDDDVRDLRDVVEREDAPIGVLLTLEEPTRDMLQEAMSAGHYRSRSWDKDYPRLQILTIEELLNGAGVKMPPPYETSEAQQVRQQGAGSPQFEPG